LIAILPVPEFDSLNGEYFMIHQVADPFLKIVVKDQEGTTPGYVWVILAVVFLAPVSGPVIGWQ